MRSDAFLQDSLIVHL